VYTCPQDIRIFRNFGERFRNLSPKREPTSPGEAKQQKFSRHVLRRIGNCIARRNSCCRLGSPHTSVPSPGVLVLAHSTDSRFESLKPVRCCFTIMHFGVEANKHIGRDDGRCFKRASVGGWQCCDIPGGCNMWHLHTLQPPDHRADDGFRGRDSHFRRHGRVVWRAVEPCVHRGSRLCRCDGSVFCRPLGG